MTENALLSIQYCTHNHPELVNEILKKSAEDYKECGIDVYYYDSSTNGETKAIVQGYIATGYDNIYYVPVEGKNLCQKVEMIFSGKGLEKKYDYVWPSKDRTSISKEALEEVILAAESGFDIIHIAAGYIAKDKYDSAIEYYHDWGGWVTSVNTTIIKTGSVLKDFEYSGKEYLPTEFMFNFNHFFYVLDGLAKVKMPSIKVVDINNRITMLFDPSKKDSLAMVLCWINHWYKVNLALPEVYDRCKEYVVKDTVSWPWMVACRKKLLEFHKEGILIEENLPVILENWSRVSDIPERIVVEIAKGEYDFKHDLSQAVRRGHVVDLLIEMMGYIKEEKMTKGQIPIENITELMLNELLNKNYDEIKLNITLGAVEDILSDLKKENNSVDDIQKYIQQLIAFLL